MNEPDTTAADRSAADAPVTDLKWDPAYPPQACEVCNTVMYGLHCKIVCPNCGYKRDCSDP